MDSGNILIASNLLLLALTAVYAFLTYRISKSNERGVAIMKEQSEAFYRPYIIITHEIDYRGIIHLLIKNTGKMKAENLKLGVDKDFYQLGKSNETLNLRNLFVFNNVIECFPPEAEIVLSLFQGIWLDKATPDDTDTPTVFKINASYTFMGKSITETTIIDLRVYRNTFLKRDPVETALSNLGETLKEVKDILSKNV